MRVKGWKTFITLIETKTGVAILENAGNTTHTHPQTWNKYMNSETQQDSQSAHNSQHTARQGGTQLVQRKLRPPHPHSLYHRSHSLSLAEGQMALFDNLLAINLPTHGLPFPSPSHITLYLSHTLFHLWAPSPLPTLCLPLSLCPALSSMANSSLQAMFRLLLSLPAPDL